MITYEYYGYPKDFIFQYQKGVQAVTKADVLRVAKEYLKPEAISIVAVGKPSDFGKPLTTLGEVKQIDLSIPEPSKGPAPAVNGASVTRGRALLQKAQQALGGADKLAAVKDYTQKVDAVFVAPQGEMKASQINQWMQSGTFRQTQELPFGKVVVFYDGKSNWVVTPQGEMEMPPPMLRQMQGERMRSFFALMLSDRNADLTLSAVGDNALTISNKEGDTVRLTIDSATGLPSQMQYASVGPQGPAEVVANVSDWKEVSGIRLPHKFVIEQGGQKFADATVTGWTLNGGLSSEELSKKP
jgi:zinc protease